MFPGNGYERSEFSVHFLPGPIFIFLQTDHPIELSGPDSSCRTVYPYKIAQKGTRKSLSLSMTDSATSLIRGQTAAAHPADRSVFHFHRLHFRHWPDFSNIFKIDTPSSSKRRSILYMSSTLLNHFNPRQFFV